MRRICLTICFVCGVFMTQNLMGQSDKPRPESTVRASRIIAVPADDGTRSAEIRQVDIADNSGHRGAIVLIYEPVSGAWWWTFRASARQDTSDMLDPFLSGLRIAMSGSHLYVFGFAGHRLELREESGKATGIDDARTQAVADLGMHWADLQTGAWLGTRFIDLNPIVGGDFLHLKDSAALLPTATLRSVVRRGNQWLVTLDGPNRDAVQITLSDSFGVVGVAPVPAKSTE